MFEIGWTEMLVIAIVMIVAVGPKDLPKMLRTFGKTVAKMRGMAGDFQKQFNEALKEAELDDVKKSVDALRGLNPTAEIKKQLNPFEKAAADVRAGLDEAMRPKPSTSGEPASPVAHVAEPLKTGPANLPGVAGPDAMPSAPIMTPSPAVVAAVQPVPAKAKSAAKSKPAAAAPVAKAAPKPAKPAPAKPAATAVEKPPAAKTRAPAAKRSEAAK